MGEWIAAIIGEIISFFAEVIKEPISKLFSKKKNKRKGK